MRTTANKIIFVFLVLMSTSYAYSAPTRIECLEKLGNNVSRQELDACVNGVRPSANKVNQSSSIDTSTEEKVCIDLGFRKKTEGYANCVLELMSRNTAPAQVATNDPDDATCRRYGFKPKSNEYATCRLQIDQAKQDAQRQQAQYDQQQKQYQAQLEEQKKQKSRAAGLALMQMGAGISSGAYNATNGYGTLPTPPNPNRTYIMPGGGIMNCHTVNNVTTCF